MDISQLEEHQCPERYFTFPTIPTLSLQNTIPLSVLIFRRHHAWQAYMSKPIPASFDFTLDMPGSNLNCHLKRSIQPGPVLEGRR